MNIRENSKPKLGNRTIFAPVSMLIISLVSLAINTVVIKQQDTSYHTIIRSASNIESLSQQLTASSLHSIKGSAEAINEVKDHRDAIDQKISHIADTNSFPSFISQPQAFVTLNEEWKTIRNHTKTVIENENELVSFGKSVVTLRTLTTKFQTLSATISDQVSTVGGNSQQVMLAQQQVLLAGRILVRTSELSNQTTSDQISTDIKQLQSNLNKMLSGRNAIKTPSIVKSLKQASITAKELAQIILPINQLMPMVSKAAMAASSIERSSKELFFQSSLLISQIDEQDENSLLTPITGYLFALLSFFSVIWIGLAIYRETNLQLANTEQENRHNQEAILTLLDELGNLADGDLTTYVTVTEDFTGAIADSINYTIDQLRILVSSINETSVRVSGSAEGTQDTASQLAKASLQQAKEIAGATNAVNKMVSSIEQVSRNASESTTTAEQFLRIANTGADVVDNTLRGMDTIREQIQDTSKRIKRLSESSQEIGDIVSLIDDIADQTNILALNAAIQASMAGDAGRGFAVVADEVQRLAERSSAATKQIEALVKTIQSDTNEAGISMEKTTTEVVNGARLAKDAASALGDIEKVSSSLATLIDNISVEAQQQLGSVEDIAQTMNTIQQITTQTLDGSQATSKSIGKLTSISAELQETVAGFQLPSDGKGTPAQIQGLK